MVYIPDCPDSMHQFQFQVQRLDFLFARITLYKPIWNSQVPRPNEVKSYPYIHMSMIPMYYFSIALKLIPDRNSPIDPHDLSD